MHKSTFYSLYHWLDKYEERHREWCEDTPGGQDTTYFDGLLYAVWDFTSPHKYWTIES